MVGALIHWLIIFGIMVEKTPFVLTMYFHSLAVINIIGGTGILMMKQWGRMVGLLIATTQIPAHLAMVILGVYYNYDSGLTIVERGVDIGFAVFFLVFYNHPKVKSQFE